MPRSDAILPKDAPHMPDSITSLSVDAVPPLLEYPFHLSGITEESISDAMNKRLIGEDFAAGRAEARFTKKSFDQSVAFANDRRQKNGKLKQPQNDLTEALAKQTTSGKQKLQSHDFLDNPWENKFKETGSFTEFLLMCPLNFQSGFPKKELVKDGPFRAIIDIGCWMRINGCPFSYAFIEDPFQNQYNCGTHTTDQLSEEVTLIIQSGKYSHVMCMDVSKWDARIGPKHILQSYIYMMRAFGLKMSAMTWHDGKTEEENIVLWLSKELIVKPHESDTAKAIKRHVAREFRKKTSFKSPEGYWSTGEYLATRSSGDFLTYFFNTVWNEFMVYVWAKDKGYKEGKDYKFLASGDDSLLFVVESIADKGFSELSEVFEEEYKMKLSPDDCLIVDLRQPIFEFPYCGKIYYSHLSMFVPHYVRWMGRYHALLSGRSANDCVQSRCLQLIGRLATHKNSFCGRLAEVELVWYLNHQAHLLGDKINANQMDQDTRRKFKVYGITYLPETKIITMLKEKVCEYRNRCKKSILYHDMATIDEEFGADACADYLAIVKTLPPRQWPRGFFKNKVPKRHADYRKVEDDEFKAAA